MKYEIMDSTVSTSAIHPESIFDKELDLAKKFVEENRGSIYVDRCPICGCKNHELFFQKWGQQYVLCSTCWSLYLLYIPTEEVLEEYFQNSELAKYRASKYYESTVAETRKEIWLNQAEWIGGRIKRYIGMNKYNIADWGTKSTLWYNILKNSDYSREVFMIEPMYLLNEHDKADDIDVICALDVMQRYNEPNKLLEKAEKKLKTDGLLLLTCRSGSGFDILTLKENSFSIFPYDHICLPSPNGIKHLIQMAGFEVVELATPGLLDVDIVRQNSENIPKNQHFQRYMLTQSENVAFERLQAFLQRNNLSSHLRVVAKKLGDKK